MDLDFASTIDIKMSFIVFWDLFCNFLYRLLQSVDTATFWDVSKSKQYQETSTEHSTQ